MFKKNIKYYGITIIITTIILFIIFLLKQLFPFGGHSLLTGDLLQQNTPFLYNFYDVITGNTNIFFNQLISSGSNNFYESIVEIVNPINYILLLSDRSKIYLNINILFILYVVLTSLTCNIALNKLNPKNKYINIALSVLYAFSAYTAYMYQVIRWMYLPLLFPLFILAYRQLLTKDKGLYYSLFVCYFFVLGTQNAFSLVLFVLFSSFIYIFIFVDKEDRRKKFCLLGIYTFLGVLLSSFALIPNIDNILNSTRSIYNKGYIDVLKDFSLNDLFERFYIIFNPLVIIFMFINWKNKNKTIKFFKYLLIFLYFTCLFSATNFLWHMGSYMCFPLRYGYIIIFVNTLFLSYIIDKNQKNKTQNKVLSIVFSLFCFIFLTFICFFAIRYGSEISNNFTSLAIFVYSKFSVNIIIIMMILAFLSALLIYLIKNKKLFIIMLLIYSIVISFSLFYISVYSRSNNSEYILLSKLYLDNENDFDYERMKDNGILNLNSAMVSKYNSIAGYLPSGNLKYYTFMKKIGYSENWVKNTSIGGTIVSDALFRNKYYLVSNSNQVNEQLYNKIKSYDDYDLYETKYILPFGFNINGNPFIDDDNISLKNQNTISKQILGQSFDFYEEFNTINSNIDNNKINKIDTNEESGIEYNIYINNSSILYFEGNNDPFIYKIYVNDQLFDNTTNLTVVDSNVILELGTFEEESVNIKVIMNGVDSISIPLIASIDVNSFIDLINNYTDNNLKLKGNKITGTINVETDDQILLVDIANIKGWSATINGKKSEIVNAYNGLIGIKLNKGKNKIVIKFIPKGIKLGFFVSLLSIVLLILFFNFKQLTNKISKLKIISIAYYILLGAFTLILYLVPLIFRTAYILKIIIKEII